MHASVPLGAVRKRFSRRALCTKRASELPGLASTTARREADAALTSASETGPPCSAGLAGDPHGPLQHRPAVVNNRKPNQPDFRNIAEG